MSRMERIRNNKRMAQNRLALKEQYIPVLVASDLSEEMKERYYRGIAEERAYIASLEEKLRVETK